MKKEILFRHRRIKEWIPDQTENILDIGCGNGILVKYISDKANLIIGSDIDYYELSSENKKNKSLNFVICRAESLCFKNDTFNLITLADSFEHVTNKDQAISELYRVLKFNCCLIISAPYKSLSGFLDPDNLIFNNLFFMLKFLRIKKHSVINKESKYYCQNFNYLKNLHNHLSIKDFKEYFKNNFIIEKKYRGGFVLYPLIFLLRKFLDLFCRFIKINRFRSISNFKENLMNILIKIENFDFSINYGILSYNIILKIRKIKASNNY